HPPQHRQLRTLRVRNRDDRSVVEHFIEGLEVGEIEPAVKRRQSPTAKGSEQRKLEKVDVEVNDIEFIGAPSNLIQHHYVVWQMIQDGRIEPQRLFAAGH